MTKKSLIEFPCLFPLKIIGMNHESFLDEIKQIVLKHTESLQEEHVKHTLSQKNNYLAITIHITAENQEMLDALYHELTKHPNVKMVL
jgi:putative lipoic acid-binding regulatory protein